MEHVKGNGWKNINEALFYFCPIKINLFNNLATNQFIGLLKMDLNELN